MSSRHLLIVAVVGLFSSAHADTIYVDDDNCPGPGSGTEGDPYCSIQTAIDNAVEFDEIVVAEGTYFEAINFLGKAITVRSLNPDDPYVVANTTINGAGYFHVVQCVNGEGPFTILQGFTITGGDASGSGEDGYGGGMYNYNSSPTVANCVFSDNTANHGGGMFNWEYSSPTVTDCAFMNNSAVNQGGGMHNSVSCDPTVTNCTFSGNRADLGGGMYNTDSCIPTVTNCTFSGNIADSSGGGMYNTDSCIPTVTNCTFSGNKVDSFGGGMFNTTGSSPMVNNCTFSGNTADGSGGGMYSGTNSNPEVTNCTFSGNTADSSGGGMANSSGDPTVTNCIFWGDMPNEIDNSAGSTPLVSYSDVQGSGGSGAWDPLVGTDGGGNIDSDPLFANPAGGNLRLLRHSPCTDAGNTMAVPPDVFTDLAGNPRFVDDASVPDTGIGNPCVDMGAFERQSDSAGPVTVPGDFVTIQAAIDYCIYGEEILVAPGTYFEMINFWGKAITLRSSDGPDVTVIDAQGSGSGVRCESGEGLDTILDGFTIRGGSTGMYNSSGSSPTVSNCTFSGNTAATGGGMYNYYDSSPTVTDCTFSNNSSTYGGGGMANVLNSNPTVTNCTFSGNTAGDDAYSGDGGGMYNQESSPTLTNCVFSGNSALNGGLGGGMYNFWDNSPTVTNCTFSGNEAGYGGGIYNAASSFPTVTDCTFIGNSGGSSGGGICNYPGGGTVTKCVFSGNVSANKGGGICNLWGGGGTVTNCVFSANSAGQGGGMFNEDSGNAWVTNCTFSGNSAVFGGAVLNESLDSCTLANCIVWGNSLPQIDSVSATTVTFSDVQGGYPGTGNISVDPMCVDPDNGDLRLMPSSPCIDAGDNLASPPAGDTDLDGNPRRHDEPGMPDTGNGDPPIVDMGAYEFQGASCPCDCEDPPDGQVDVGDFLALLAQWGEVGSCDCEHPPDGQVDVGDFLAILATWGPCP